MKIRPLMFPNDLAKLQSFLGEAFLYPEDEGWNVQPDEKRNFADLIENITRLWPIIRFIQRLSPSLRDLLRGYVGEEDGRLVGTAFFQKSPGAPAWYISTVAVLPGYRRKGVARSLVSAALEAIEAKGGQRAILEVIKGNTPALALYRNLGFEHYTGSVQFIFQDDMKSTVLPMPEGYSLREAQAFHWRPDLELDGRIVPEYVQRFEPVDETNYRLGLGTRTMMRIQWFASGLRMSKYVLRTVSEDLVVAIGRAQARARPGGMNRLKIRLDPDHSLVANVFLGHLLSEVQAQSPGRNLIYEVPDWEDGLIMASRELGGVERYRHLRLGLEL